MNLMTKEQYIAMLKERDDAVFFDFTPIKQKKSYIPKRRAQKSNDISSFARRLNRNPTTLFRKSCIHFDKTKQGAREHNFREYAKEREPDYLLPNELRKENEFWELTNERGETITGKQIFQNEIKAYQGKGKRPKYENSTWEAVLVLNENHTMNDLQRVREYVERTLNITCYSMAIHRDEGHLNEFKEPIYNYHAHMNFITIKNKQQNFRLTKTKRLMPSIQSEVAKILGMQRGDEKSGRQHLQPKEYKQLIADKIEIKNLKHELQSEKNKEKFTKTQAYRYLQEQKFPHYNAKFDKLGWDKEHPYRKNFFENVAEYAKKLNTREVSFDEYLQQLDFFEKKLDEVIFIELQSSKDLNSTYFKRLNELKENHNNEISILKSEHNKELDNLKLQLKEFKSTLPPINTPQNNKNGSKIDFNQKNDELPQKEKEIDLNAKIEKEINKLNENMRNFSVAISNSKPKYMQEMLKQAQNIQSLSAQSPNFSAERAKKALESFAIFCKENNLSFQRT